MAGGPFASQMITGASVSARSQNHYLVIGESQGDLELEELLIGEMLDRRVDGIVYAKVVTARDRRPDVLRNQRAVLLNCFDRSARLPAVVPDEYEGGRAASAAVLDGGIAAGIHVVGDRPLGGAIAGPLRFDGIRDGLRASRAAVASEIPCGWTVREAFEAVSAFLDSGHRPEALICMNDRIAMGTYQALGEHGLWVPGDVSVVSFDGSDLGEWLRPMLTSVVVPYAEHGRPARSTSCSVTTARPGPPGADAGGPGSVGRGHARGRSRCSISPTTGSGTSGRSGTTSRTRTTCSSSTPRARSATRT